MSKASEKGISAGGSVAVTDDELRANIKAHAVKLIEGLKAQNDEQVCRKICKQAIVIVVDLIFPGSVFLEHPYTKAYERLVYDACEYRFVWAEEYGVNNLETVFAYLTSPQWHDFVDQINFEDCRDLQPRMRQSPKPAPPTQERVGPQKTPAFVPRLN